ncbi:undecaprenyl-phosphate glucose phosphotransferase [Nafulsella turpanensis]|uniref:undecaprenyl-phosphate glucose phosphotransferase n=1 Tax=Nafulsella turpanensis TaxID=1265690 RepID=UPI000475BD14|nr:undecaprenyl-phosphate glucose phosphotransferase [Nafulsella turpanensis]
MTYKYATFVKWINVVSDYLLLNLSLCLFFTFECPHSFWDSTSENYRLSFLILNLIWFYCSSLVRQYENVIIREAIPTVKVTISALTIYLLAGLAMVVAFPKFSLSLSFLLSSFVFYAILILFIKVTFLAIRKSRRRFWQESKKVVIVGGGAVVMDLYKYINENPHLGYMVEGMFDDDLLQQKEANLKILGKVDDCFNYVLTNNVKEVFNALPMHAFDKAQKLMEEADKHLIRCRLVPDVKAFFDKNILLEVYGYMPILTPRKEPLDNKANEIIKRCFDIAFSLLVILLLLSWLVPLVGIMIKLESKGPVFFKQLRSGKGNKAFYCLKFRSMHLNNESDSKQAVKGDKRITRVGAFLRKTSMDELPQFFNVLMGDMSVVGPRPHMLQHTRDYSVLINNFMVRHFLTPGITGWAQVNGFRGETRETDAMSKRVEADLWYLENWSLLLDLKIIFLTIWQGIRGDENAW